jgi:hypothetical protein
MSKTAPPKRGRGRPRNPALDALERDLAVSRRHASTMLRELKQAGGGTSANSEKSMTPLAEARLEKTLKECRLLETKIRAAELEERALSRELLYSSEAVELVNAAIQPLVNTLRTWPKSLAPRLHGQPMKSIENAILDATNALLENARTNLATIRWKVGKDL